MPSSLGKYSGMLGVIASIPAIFFAFDGFYAAGGIYNEMKDKNKFFKPLIFGIIIIATIYVLISISLLLGSDGTILGISSQSNQP
jgi:amino acid transporter